MRATDPGAGVATYDAIAQEYYDATLHPTCGNFNSLSRVYLRRHIEVLASRRSILEIGAGNSAVAELLHAAKTSLEGLTITDSSAEMLGHSRKWAAHGARLGIVDAEHVDSQDESLDVVVSSLGDPYNSPAFWRQVARVLRRNGLAIFTMPSFQWAGRYRNASGGGLLDRAEFLLKDGSKVYVPSMVPPLDAQIEMMESAGLVVVDFEELGADRLGSAETHSPKIAVFGNDPSSLVWGFLARKDADPVSRVVRQSFR